MRRRLIAILLGLSLVAGGVSLFFDSADATRLTLNKYIGDPALNGFRLTLTSGTAVTTADVTGATTLYYTPYKGDNIVLWDGTNWQLYQSAEVSLALGTLADASNYDVWVLDADSDGDLDLEWSAAWTNDTTRSQAVATTNGVTHKSGDQTRRLVGTIRTTSTTTCEDSAAKRFVWNASNRVQRAMQHAAETTDSWNYTSAAWRQANANTANQLMYVVGLGEDAVEARVHGNSYNTGNNWVSIGIGVDSITANSAQTHGSVGTNIWSSQSASYYGVPGVGYHYIAWLEWSAASGTTTWTGDAGLPGNISSGIIGTVWN